MQCFLCRYVVEKDVKHNVVFVSRSYYSVDKRRRLFRVGSLKWLSGMHPNQINRLQCKVQKIQIYHNSHTLSSFVRYQPALGSYHLLESEGSPIKGDNGRKYQNSNTSSFLLVFVCLIWGLLCRTCGEVEYLFV